MGLFDIFTGQPAIDAAEENQAYLTQTGTNNTNLINTGLTTSLADIGTGYSGANTALGGSYGSATDALTRGYGQGQNYLTQGANSAVSSLEGGAKDALGALDKSANAAYGAYDTAYADFGKAAAAYDPLSDLAAKYGQSTSLYQDALGVNGQAGIDNATNAFQPSQSYTFNYDQGIDAIVRAQNAMGQGNSGNTYQEAQTFGAGLASQEYGGWMDRLAGFIDPELQATAGAATGRANAYAGQAGVNTSRAAFESEYGQNTAGIYSELGTGLADTYNTLGTNRASLASNEANALSGLEQWYGGQSSANLANQGTAAAALNTNAASAQVNSNNTLAIPYTQQATNAAAAEIAGASSLWNLGLNAAKLGVTSGASLGSLGSTNPSSSAYGSNPFTPTGGINYAYL